MLISTYLSHNCNCHFSCNQQVLSRFQPLCNLDKGVATVRPYKVSGKRSLKSKSMDSARQRFTGKTALVTGAGRGFGRATAIALHNEGANVIAMDIMQENLDSLKNEYPEIHTIPIDICDWDNTRKAIESLDTIDLLVNNAGILKVQSILETTEEVIDQTMDVNFKAVINISAVVAKKLVANGRPGAIVNVSSLGALGPTRNQGLYCASKAAVQMISDVMALEFGPHNIRVNCINPGPVATDLGRINGDEVLQYIAEKTPLGRLATVEEITKGILFLLSDEIPIMHGHHLVVDGGFRYV